MIGVDKPTVPVDLFIPPDALEVLLDSFSGPLDLLLYLVKRQNQDILTISMALIAEQYIDYIQKLTENRRDLAPDYLVMAAILAEIKSRLLLPREETTEEMEDDPRALLIKKLKIYEQFKDAAANLDKLPRCERDIFRISLPFNGVLFKVYPSVEFIRLHQLMNDLVRRQQHEAPHAISLELLSVRERMKTLITYFTREKTALFLQLLTEVEGRMGVVVTLLAILELARQSLIEMTQTVAYGPILIEWQGKSA